MEKYTKYIQKIYILNLKTDELLINKLGYLVYDEYNFNSYLNILKLFKTNNFIKNNMDELEKTSYNIKIINNIYNKIGLLREFENIYNITPFELNFELKENIPINKLSNEKFTIYKKIFRSEKNQPINISELKAFYVQMFKNIVGGNIKIINKNIIKNEETRITRYEFDISLIKTYYEISIRKGNNHNYNYDLLKIFNIVKPNDYIKYSFIT
jgi:hypothetical protein